MRMNVQLERLNSPIPQSNSNRFLLIVSAGRGCHRKSYFSCMSVCLPVPSTVITHRRRYISRGVSIIANQRGIGECQLSFSQYDNATGAPYVKSPNTNTANLQTPRFQANSFVCPFLCHKRGACIIPFSFVKRNQEHYTPGPSVYLSLIHI